GRFTEISKLPGNNFKNSAYAYPAFYRGGHVPDWGNCDGLQPGENHESRKAGGTGRCRGFTIGTHRAGTQSWRNKTPHPGKKAVVADVFKLNSDPDWWGDRNGSNIFHLL